jgi:hypothetical protein
MDMLSAEEAASFLHMNVKRVQALARAGKLPVGGSAGGGCSTTGARGHAGRPAPGGSGLDLSARNQLSGRVVGSPSRG